MLIQWFRRAGLALALLLMSLPAHAQPAVPGGVFGAESFTLKNGLQVVVIPNHRAPVVTHMLWYKVGSADEQPGKSGLAHFLEHLLFKGTPRYPDGAIVDVVARTGGNQNAFTSYDYTGYFQTIAVEHLPLMMDMEADRMRNLTLDKPGVDKEREVIIEERRMRVDSVPNALLGERMANALWMDNHYGVPVIGWEREMRGLTSEDAFAFYNQYYAPQNAILVVAGDITAAKLKPLAEKYYGPIPSGGPAVKRTRSTDLAPPSAVRVELEHERVRQPQWQRDFIAPSYNVGDRDDVHGLEVFAELFGGGTTAKLYRALVAEQQLAANASAGYTGETISYGTFSISMTPNPGVAMEEMEKAFETLLAQTLQDGITDADVARAKNRMLARLAFARESPFGAAQQLGAMLTVGMTLEEIETWPEKVKKVTTDQVRNAARKLVASTSSVTGILLPPRKPAQGAGGAP